MTPKDTLFNSENVVVETRDGQRFLLIGTRLINESAWMDLSIYTDSLKVKDEIICIDSNSYGEWMDIVRVYVAKEIMSFVDMFADDNLILVLSATEVRVWNWCL